MRDVNEIFDNYREQHVNRQIRQLIDITIKNSRHGAGVPNSLKWVPSEISSDSLLILPIPYIRRERRIFHGVVDAFSARFQRAMMMKSCAFTCLSRATGGVWHDLSRVANLPEDLDAAFFSPRTFSTSAFAKSVSGWFCLPVTLLSSSYRRRTPSSSRRDETGISLGKCASPWLSSAMLCGMFLHRRRSLLVARRLLATCMHGASTTRGK